MDLTRLRHGKRAKRIDLQLLDKSSLDLLLSEFLRPLLTSLPNPTRLQTSRRIQCQSISHPTPGLPFNSPRRPPPQSISHQRISFHHIESKIRHSTLRRILQPRHTKDGLITYLPPAAGSKGARGHQRAIFLCRTSISPPLCPADR